MPDGFFRFLRWICAFGVFPAILLICIPAYAALSVEGAAATADYWTRTSDDVLLITTEENEERTQDLVTKGLVQDLPAASVSRSGFSVRSLIRQAAQGEDEALPDLYDGAQPLTPAVWQQVCDNRALARVGARVTVQPAVAVRRADVRLLPTAAGWYESPNDVRYDVLQGTVLDPGEAVLVLHRSADTRFAFVETRDYYGWVDERAIADTDWRSWLGFAAPEEFFTVTATQLQIEERGLLYQLGAKIPGVRAEDGTFQLLLPERDVGGHLTVREYHLPDDGGLTAGYLPATRNNLIRLAFLPLHTAYGWGGANEGMDCSSYVQNVYRAMGISLPRDAHMQERSCLLLPLAGLSAAERYALLADVPPGALLFRPGHVMLYLGRDAGGIPLVIHDISSYYENGEKKYIRQVVVSTLDFQNECGTAAIDTLDGIGLIAPAP